jgi:hypothetical protein
MPNAVMHGMALWRKDASRTSQRIQFRSKCRKKVGSCQIFRFLSLLSHPALMQVAIDHDKDRAMLTERR